jgi:hypothetical protein
MIPIQSEVLHSLPRPDGEIPDAGSSFESLWNLRCLVSFITFKVRCRIEL